MLKKGGTLYLFDFLLSNHPSSLKKYEQGHTDHGEWGVYTTNEGLTVRHFQTATVMKLLDAFDVQWFEQHDFKTMNNNPARVFQCFANR